MYKFLLISSSEGSGVDALKEQIKYLSSFQIDITLLIDPSELELVKCIENNIFDAAYVHIKRRTSKNSCNYDPVKLLEYYSVPIVGNHYITQMLITDKCLTSKESGIGLPGVIITREMWKANRIPYETIEEIQYPVIVKPNSLHASQGISQNSIVFSNNTMNKQIDYVFSNYTFLKEVLIEKYLEPATEFTVSVLGNGNSLACSVTKFVFKDKSKHNVYSEKDKESKLQDRSFEFSDNVSAEDRDRLASVAKALFKHYNMKDFARFDFIKNETIYLLEANCCPIPGNSFSWEWQKKYGLKKHQVLALFLCAFHFGQVSSGRPDSLPFALINDIPQQIIEQISHPCAIDVKPECTEMTTNCAHPQLFSMNSRVGSESEVITFLKSLTTVIKPNLILETGTYNGNGTIAFAEGVIENGFGKVISIEFDEELAQNAKRKFAEYPVEIVCGSSLSYTPNNLIDILFLDSKRSIRKEEFLRYKPFLHKHSLIIWHDSSYRERNHLVYDSVNELYEAGIIDRILLPTPRGITLSMLKDK